MIKDSFPFEHAVTSAGNPLDSEASAFYQPDMAIRLTTPEHQFFETAERAKEYIATKVDVAARTNDIKLSDDAMIRVNYRPLDDGQFTNVYDLSVDASAVFAGIHADTKSKGVNKYLLGVANPIAAISGGFLYLADVGSGVPRQKALNLALNARGVLSSIPVTDRECLVSDYEGKLSTMFLPACGELTVDGKTLSWAGSRTSYDADCRVFGNGNVVIKHAASNDPASRKDRIRVLEESSRYTPVIEDESLIDVGLIASECGEFKPIRMYSGGNVDLFRYDAVIRCDAGSMPNGINSNITMRTVGQLALDKEYQGAISVGPMLSEDNFGTHPINSDPSLGSDPPFAATRMVRLAIYETVNNRIHVKLFDGRPESSIFRGVTPQEAVSIIKEEDEIVWGAFLDPGRTAKISALQDDCITNFGNAHYLRWPENREEKYEWVPGAGRPVPSAITLAVPGRVG